MLNESGKPKTTRLRYIKSKDPNALVEFLNQLGVRVQIYGAPVYAKNAWFLWFVPSDSGQDINSIDLDA